MSVRLGALEDVGRSEEEELGLRVFVGRRSASVSTCDLSSAAMDTLVERAVAMAREAPEDQWAGLAPEERLLKGPIPDLDLHDGDDPAPAALKEAALAAEDAARAVPGVTNSEGGGASASRVAWALATSHGFAGAYQTTSHGIQASVLAAKPADRWCATTPIIRRATARISTRPTRSAARPASARSRGSTRSSPPAGRCRSSSIRASDRR